jgi:hypothetical protein
VKRCRASLQLDGRCCFDDERTACGHLRGLVDGDFRVALRWMLQRRRRRTS